MVKILLNETGKELDILGGKITFVKQVGDIGDITSINASYSWQFKFPKTPTNTIALEGLGFTGDRSRFPYTKNRCTIIDNGVAIATNCLLIVKETADEYKAYVQEGVVEFFQAVSSDKISEVIDLTDLSHTSDVSTIIASFTANLPYKYIIASYNGPPLANVSGYTNLNPLGLVPSVNLKYLWDKIFEYYGWTYEGSFDLSDKWMTYPTAKSYEDANNIQVLEVNAQPYTYSTLNDQDQHRIRWNIIGIVTPYISYLTPTDQRHTIVFGEPGNYRIKFNIKGYFRRYFPYITYPFETILRINGVDYPLAVNSSDDDDYTTWDFIAYTNTIVQLIAVNPTHHGGQIVVFPDSHCTIETLGVQQIDFSEALIKYKVKDFFKEVMTRFSLTAFVDTINKHIKFMSLEERLDADFINWSDKYVRRKSESYIYENYAQNNYMKHKYNEEEADYFDGILQVDNKNLPIEKELYKSNIYAPLEELVVYDKGGGNTYQVNNFKMFDIDVKEDPETGDLLADYKALKDRFYIIQDVIANWTIYILGTPVTSFPLAITTGNTYNEIVINKYGRITELLKDARLHSFELHLSKWDVATLNLQKKYYFKQEAGYYLLNKLIYKTDQLCTGEFVRIRK